MNIAEIEKRKASECPHCRVGRSHICVDFGKIRAHKVTRTVTLTDAQGGFLASPANPRWLQLDRGEGKTFALCAAVVGLCVRHRVHGLLVCGSDFLAREIVAPTLAEIFPLARFLKTDMKFEFVNGSTAIVIGADWEDRAMGWTGDFVAMDYDPVGPPTSRQVDRMMAMTRPTPNRPTQGYVMIAGGKPE